MSRKVKRQRLKAIQSWREFDADAYETTCLCCDVGYIAEELEAAVNRRDGEKALDLVHELEWHVEEISTGVHDQFRENMAVLQAEEAHQDG
jgi:hypothetical protein